VSYSFYEVYITAQRAFTGMKFPFGADEDAGYIVAWLELNKLQGIKILNDNIKKIDKKYDGKIKLNTSKNIIDLKNKSILMKGPGLIDYYQSILKQKNRISFKLKNCSLGIIFLPLLHKASKEIKISTMICHDLKNRIRIFQITKKEITVSKPIKKKLINKNEIKITLANDTYFDLIKNNEKIIDNKSIQKKLSKSIKPHQKAWERISKIANRTFVPKSSDSRKKGAGGGDAND
tara:strand:+ start:29 stop:730 length:702 start_codon:yes stop_codon:yes gene_type:complete